MVVAWIEKINSPWIVTLLAILISESIFIVIGLLYMGTVPLFGIIVSFVIPACSAYPVSSIMLKYHTKIQTQKNELEHLDRINKRLFTTISHDIKSPLANASVLMELVASETITIEETKSHLKSLNMSIKVLIRFLDDLLKWSRYQIDKNPLQPDVFDTEIVLAQCIELYKNIVSEKKFELKINNLSGSVFADRGSYSFVVRNVLQNAIKYTPRGGTLTIHVEENPDQIITIITDTGMGMDKVKIEKIKAKSNYLSSKGTNEEAGTGFGLKASIEYLESQNGFLSIKSEKDIGTSVSICLPKS